MFKLGNKKYNILLSQEENEEPILIKKKKKNIKFNLHVIKVITSIILFVLIISGISYAYFYYFQEDPRQANIMTGEVYVRVPGNVANITLNKLYPTSVIDARNRDDNYIDFTVNAKNTSATKTLYYTLNIKDGNDVANKSRISREYIKVDLSEKINGNYVDILENVDLNGFAFNDFIPANTTNEITREYRFRMWIGDNIIVSDTETNAIFTQSEFANLFASYAIDVNAYDGLPSICKRVIDTTKLHKEICTNSSTSEYCRADGYTLNSNIIYGNAKQQGSPLVLGDAFDCDVNGDGNYNERFYYISDYYNTSTKTFDTSTAVLIYYSNTMNNDGVVGTSLSGGSYYSLVENWHGPSSIINNLPTTTNWDNITLKTSSRTVLACNDGNCSNTSLTTNNGSNTIVNPFSYTSLAARLLTVQELKKTECYALSNKASQTVTGSLKACNFLFEGTKYANSSNLTNGLWLENPIASSSQNIFITSSSSRYVNTIAANNTTYGIRPVIDVPYSRLEY